MASSGLTNIGAYQLMALIRAGHTCEIWDVQSASDGTRWGMKLLPAGEKHTREQVAFLKHEYQVGRILDHERVISTYEYGSGRLGSFIIMELFKHPNLKQQIFSGSPRIAYLLETIVREAAEGLSYLHEQGWIHCDIKPDNFLVDHEGHVRLIDFNLAVRRKSALARMFSSKSKIQGTMSYMSPEQIRGQSLDARSDIYGFGCMLYELAGGRMPFTGVNSNDLLNKHLKSKALPLTVGNDNITEPFAQLVARMMAKKPANRPATMDEILAEMSGIQIYRRRPEPPQEDDVREMGK